MSVDMGVPGLPDVFTVRAVETAASTRYFPKVNGRSLMRRDGMSASVAWYPTFDEARDALYEFVGQMQ